MERAAGRGAGRKSVPLVHATGSMTIGVLRAGMPSSSLARSSSLKIAVTHDVPRPRARRATQKLQAAWITESNRPGLPLPSCRPMIVTKTRAGTSARCAAR